MSRRQTRTTSIPASTSFWNAAAFSIPAPLTFGNEPRSLASARFFPSTNEDATLGKKTRLFDEKLTVDFRAEFFNILNRHTYLPNVGGPNLATPFAPVGSPGCSGPFACGFGSVTNASGPRTIQFGLKLDY